VNIIRKLKLRVLAKCQAFIPNSSAVTAIQVALLAAAIVLVVGLGIRTIGSNTNSVFTAVSTSV